MRLGQAQRQHLLASVSGSPLVLRGAGGWQRVRLGKPVDFRAREPLRILAFTPEAQNPDASIALLFDDERRALFAFEVLRFATRLLADCRPVPTRVVVPSGQAFYFERDSELPPAAAAATREVEFLFRWVRAC